MPERPKADRVCRCAAVIDPRILEGYACGRPDCWRTAEVAASFEGFVTELVRKRGDEPAPRPTEPQRI